MTKQEVNAITKKLAGAFGFTTEDRSDTIVITEPDKDWSHRVVNFTTWHDEADWTDECVTVKLKFSASIATMGGSPTPDELLRAAEIIRNAGLLVMNLNELKLSYTHYYRKGGTQE